MLEWEEWRMGDGMENRQALYVVTCWYRDKLNSKWERQEQEENNQEGGSDTLRR
jgi:hypothetical protein